VTVTVTETKMMLSIPKSASDSPLDTDAPCLFALRLSVRRHVSTCNSGLQFLVLNPNLLWFKFPD